MSFRDDPGSPSVEPRTFDRGGSAVPSRHVLWFGFHGARREARARLTIALDCRSASGGGRHHVCALYQLRLRSAHGTRNCQLTLDSVAAAAPSDHSDRAAPDTRLRACPRFVELNALCPQNLLSYYVSPDPLCVEQSSLVTS